MNLFILLTIAVTIGIKMAPNTPRLYTEVSMPTTVAHITPTPPPTKAEIVFEIAKAFEHEGADVMQQAISVAKNESGWKHNAQGWNCYYDGVSKACRKEDRVNAWSVDCGVLQINIKGKVCPEELFDVKVNVSKALSMYTRRAWQPWVSAKNLGYVN